MDLHALMASLPTLSEEKSLAVWGEILVLRTDWRCYSSALVTETEALIGRFLRIHALTPGWITPTMIAMQPMQILRGRTIQYEMWGATFLNGAIIHLANAQQEETWLLYVGDETAETFQYPKGWVRTTEFFAQASDATPSYE